MQRTRRIGRRRLLLGATAVLAALATVASAQAQQQDPAGIEWLDYDPPRPFAAGACVGNVVYLSGVTGAGLDISEQTENAFGSIRANLQALGSDLPFVFKMTVFLIDLGDQPGFGQVRGRLLPRPVAPRLSPSADWFRRMRWSRSM